MICRLAPESALSSDVLIATSRIDKPNKWPNYCMLYDTYNIAGNIPISLLGVLRDLDS